MASPLVLSAHRMRPVPKACLAAVAAALVLGGCMSDPNLAKGSGAPSYSPSNAAPPALSAAANELAIPTWQWVRTDAADGRVVNAAAPERYTLKFEGGGRVLVRADCNRGSGSYEVNGGQMKLAPIALTRMGCPPGSQDAEFVQAIGRVSTYAIDSGQLTLRLADGATMRFRATP